MTRSDELFAQALEVMPGGVSSPVRAFGSVGGTPRFVKRASGSHIIDVDDKRYVDLVCSWGPMIAGHAHPRVIEAVQAAVADSTPYGVPADPAVLAAGGQPLEGWLFPATYTFDPGVSAQQVLLTLVDRTMQSLDAAAGRAKFDELTR